MSLQLDTLFWFWTSQPLILLRNAPFFSRDQFYSLWFWPNLGSNQQSTALELSKHWLIQKKQGYGGTYGKGTYKKIHLTQLVIGTSRTVGSAKKFVRITSGFGGGEFTKTLRKVCTCQKLKFAVLLLEYCKIRECYVVANAFTIRNMHSLLLYMKCNSRKINRPTKNMTKIVTIIHF